MIDDENEGMAITQPILTNELTLVDAKPNKLQGEMLDLQHTVTFLSHTEILASSYYMMMVNLDICIIMVDAR